MLGSLTTPGRAATRADAADRVAFRLGNAVGTRYKSAFAAQWPACTIPCRRFAVPLTRADARLGASVGRYAFTVEDFHLLLLAGLPAHYQSGEADRNGRISKCGDAFTRTCLYEAANVLLTKVQRFSPLKAWGTRLVQRIGAKKARVAVARKIAVVLRCIWVDGTEFWWTREEAKMA